MPASIDRRMEVYWKDFITPLNSTLDRILSFLPQMLVASVLFLLFTVAAVLIRRLAKRSLEKITHLPWAVRVLIVRFIYLMTLFLGLMVALSAINVNVTTLVESLGVAGFVLGFALKDILENFLSGVLLLFARPFEIGDQVTLGNFEGTVSEIQLRTTTLRTYNEEMVAIPNSNVYTNPVINHTRLGLRRYHVDFDTSLNVDSDQVEREALRAVQENPDVKQEPAPFVRMTRIDSGSDVLRWQVYYWADPTKATEGKTISATLDQIKRGLYDAGVSTPTATSATILRRAGSTGNASAAHTSTANASPASDLNGSPANASQANASPASDLNGTGR